MSYVRRFIRIRFAIIATVIRTPVYCIKFPGRDFIQLQRAEVRERAERLLLDRWMHTDRYWKKLIRLSKRRSSKTGRVVSVSYKLFRTVVEVNVAQRSYYTMSHFTSNSSYVLLSKHSRKLFVLTAELHGITNNCIWFDIDVQENVLLSFVCSICFWYVVTYFYWPEWNFKLELKSFQCRYIGNDQKLIEFKRALKIQSEFITVNL